jgi:hypothetical protein
MRRVLFRVQRCVGGISAVIKQVNPLRAWILSRHNWVVISQEPGLFLVISGSPSFVDYPSKLFIRYDFFKSCSILTTLPVSSKEHNLAPHCTSKPIAPMHARKPLLWCVEAVSLMREEQNSNLPRVQRWRSHKSTEIAAVRVPLPAR